jgi:cobalt-zinc-cadmium efflux system membrane fusion protein
MYKFRIYIFLTALVFSATFFLTACERSQTVSDRNSNKGNLNPVEDDLVQLDPKAATTVHLEYEKADMRLVDFTVKTTGEVLANANMTTHISPTVTGRVTDVMARVGDQVKAGQKLLMIRSQDIEQSESDLLQNESQVRSDLKRDLLQIDSDMQTAQAQIRFSQSAYLRSKGLYEEKIASQADFEAARTQYEKDRIALDALTTKRQATISLSAERMVLMTDPIKQKLRMLGVSDEDIKIVLRKREIDPMVPVVSPGHGIVIERLVNVGELVDPSKPLFTVADFHSVWLKADVYEKDVSKVREGQPIELTLESFPGETFYL